MSKRLEGGLLGGNQDPYFSNVSLQLNMDGVNGSTRFIDSSSNGLTVTANGNAQISTAQNKFGGASALFDGSGDYLSTPHNVLFSIENSDFTLEGWVYRASSSSIQNILNKRIDTPGSGWGWRINTNNTLQFFHLAGSSITSTATVASGTWVHVAVTRSGSVVRQFIDGVMDATTATFTNGTSNTQELRIGVDNGGADGFNGYIDDLRITRGVARYTESFSPPSRPFVGARSQSYYGLWTPEQQLARRRVSTWPLGGDPSFASVSLLLSMNGANNSTTFTDSSNNAVAITANGDVKISTAQSKFNGASAFFDGNGDFLSAASSSLFNFSATPSTFECWLYPTELPASGNWCRLWMFGSNAVASSFIPVQFTNTGLVTAGVPFSGTAGLSASSPLLLNTWNYVAVVLNGANSAIYLNGISVASGTITSPTSASNNMRIGYDTTPTVNYNYKGYIDDMRITKGVARAISSSPDRPFPNNL